MSDEKKKINQLRCAVQPREAQLIPEGHKAPVTRRDFLKYGIIPFAGSMLFPSLLTQILTRGTALAKEAPVNACGAIGGGGYIPFLVFDMAGGSALPGNFLVGKKGGPKDLLASYDTLGWDPKASGSLDESFGLPMAKNQSQLLAGIKQAASPQALANLRMGSFCNTSLSDTSSNTLSALSLVSKAGLHGQFLQNGVGNRNNLSGGNSDVALREAIYKASFIQTADDIQNSISHGPAFANLSDEEIRALNRTIRDMSATQVQQFEGLTDAKKLEQLAQCGYKRNLVYGKTIKGMDYKEDSINVEQIYQNVNVTDDQAQTQIDKAVFASIAYNVIKGNTGPGALTLGGCDYHDGNSIRGDRKDLEMGQQIGAAVELAYRLKKPLFFQLLTDGGIVAKPGTRDWTADSNVLSLTVIGYYNPNKAPQQRRLQVGEYTDGQAVNQNTLIGAEPIKVANAVLANYLSACGKLGEFEKQTQVAFRNADLDSILIF